MVTVGVLVPTKRAKVLMILSIDRRKRDLFNESVLFYAGVTHSNRITLSFIIRNGSQ